MSQIAPRNAPLVCALAYDGLCTFEFGIAVELFALPRPEFADWYRYATVKAEPGPIRATGGITIEAQDDLDLLRQASLIIVPGWRGPRRADRVDLFRCLCLGRGGAADRQKRHNPLALHR